MYEGRRRDWKCIWYRKSRKNGRTFERKEAKKRRKFKHQTKECQNEIIELRRRGKSGKQSGKREKWKRLHSLVVNSSNSFCLSAKPSHPFCALLCNRIFFKIYPFFSAVPSVFFLAMSCEARDRRAQEVYTSARSERKHTFQCLSVQLYLSEHDISPNCLSHALYGILYRYVIVRFQHLDILPQLLLLLLYALCELVCLVLRSNGCCISKCWFSSSSSNGILLHVSIRFFLSLPPLWLLLAAIGVQHSTYSSFSPLLKSRNRKCL